MKDLTFEQWVYACLYFYPGSERVDDGDGCAERIAFIIESPIDRVRSALRTLTHKGLIECYGLWQGDRKTKLYRIKEKDSPDVR